MSQYAGDYQKYMQGQSAQVSYLDSKVLARFISFSWKQVCLQAALY